MFYALDDVTVFPLTLGIYLQALRIPLNLLYLLILLLLYVLMAIQTNLQLVHILLLLASQLNTLRLEQAADDWTQRVCHRLHDRVEVILDHLEALQDAVLLENVVRDLSCTRFQKYLYVFFDRFHVIY